MATYLETDVGFYDAIGALLVVIYVVAIAIVIVVDPASVDRATLIPLSVGFLLFVLVYLTALRIGRLVASEEQ